MAIAVTERGGAREMTGVEVDLGTEPARVLRAKLDRWRGLLAGGAAPRTLLITTTRIARRDALRRLVDDAGLRTAAKVVLAAELPDLLRAVNASVTDASGASVAPSTSSETPACFRVL